MKTENIILIVLIVLVSGTLAYSLISVNNSGTKTVAKAENSAQEIIPSDSLQTISTGSTSPGEVMVELTPHEITGNTLEVDYSINTHSVTLNNFDLKEITTLKIGDELIKPSNAPSLQGHHNSGTLVFPITTANEQFSITIKGIPKVDERIFSW